MRHAALLLVVSCAAEADRTCEDLCAILVNTCHYEAFPTIESCEQGCQYDAEQGEDIAAQKACIEAAGCDTFAVVECEHE